MKNKFLQTLLMSAFLLQGLFFSECKASSVSDSSEVESSDASKEKKKNLP
jgi:hypothetical protein